MLHYVEISGVPEGALSEGIVALADRVLPSPTSFDLAFRLGHRRDVWAVVALHGTQVVGFKLGYSDRPARFYSWLGGVAPEYRRRGIARELMRRQHLRCEKEGYRCVRTHSTNEHRHMLLLNLMVGFDVIGTVHSEGRGTRIVLEKPL